MHHLIVAKQKEWQTRLVRAYAIVAFVTTSLALNTIFKDRIRDLQVYPRTVKQLKDACRAETVKLAGYRLVCEGIQNECYQNADLPYEECFDEAAAVKLADVATLRATNWTYLQWLVLGACFMTTLIQWYCGVFGAGLERNKTILSGFTVANAILIGYFAHGVLVANSQRDMFYMGAPIPFLLMSGYTGAMLLQRVAQLEALPTKDDPDGASVSFRASFMTSNKTTENIATPKDGSVMV